MSTVLILGAGSDIAIAIARKFSANKCDILLAGRNIAALEPIKNDLIIRYKVNASVIVFDACNFGSHANFYKSLNSRPDITICVFGYLGNQQLAQETWQEAEKIINTNYLGAVSILNIIANDYEQKGNGIIVGISSVAGERGRQSNYLYGSAKAGFTAYLSGLRNRLFKSNVRVVSVLPGFVHTKMTKNLSLSPLLTAYPEEVAQAVYSAVQKKKNIVYVKWYWRWIMLIVRSIPEPLFKKRNL